MEALISGAGRFFRTIKYEKLNRARQETATKAFRMAQNSLPTAAASLSLLNGQTTSGELLRAGRLKQTNEPNKT
jgi:hypothetical protein